MCSQFLSKLLEICISIFLFYCSLLIPTTTYVRDSCALNRFYSIWPIVDLPSEIDVALHVDGLESHGLGLESLMFVGKLALARLR